MDDGLTSDISNQPTPAATLDQSKVVNPPETNTKLDGNYLQASGRSLLLILTPEQFTKCKDYENPQNAKQGELLMYIKCSNSEYRIAGTFGQSNTISIKSILKKSKDGKYLDGNIVRVEEEIRLVKKMLELNNDGVVKVDSVSNKPFESPVINDEKVYPEVKKTLEDLINKVLAQDSSGVESSSSADTNPEAETPKTPSAVPNESQGNSIVIPEVESPKSGPAANNNTPNLLVTETTAEPIAQKSHYVSNPGVGG